MRTISFDGTFETWISEARILLAEKIHYDQVIWQKNIGNRFTGTFFDGLSIPPKFKNVVTLIPRELLLEAEFVSCFNDFSTWRLLYKIFYRTLFEDINLLHSKNDFDLIEFNRRKLEVSDELQNLKATTQFQEIKENDESIYMGRYRSHHRILKFSAAFFTNCFEGMNWVVLTPEQTMARVLGQYQFGPGFSEMIELRCFIESLFNSPKKDLNMLFNDEACSKQNSNSSENHL